MVKGRRVQAVVATARNDDCCSPKPKRRVPGTKIALKSKTNTITAFFQEVETKTNGVAVLEEEDLKIEYAYSNDDVHKIDGVPDHQQLPMTPVMSRKNQHNNNEAAPTTPHRIELNATTQKTEKTSQTSNGINNHKLTEYFPVRRSVRKTKKTVLEEKQRSLEHLLRNHIEKGLEVRLFDDKGRGVVASKHFFKGDFVVEYSGDLIDLSEARRRELKYAQDHNAGCYMYYFKHNDQQYCVDATAESGRLGRLVNHSRNGNLLTRTVFVDRKPRLVLIAKYDIKQGEEVTYDYGDRSKESLRHHPWLAY